MKLLLFFLFLVNSNAFAGNFEEPACLKTSVDFWYDIYVKYDKDVGVVFDVDTLEVLRVVSMPEDDNDRAEIIQKIKKEYEDEGVKVRVQKGIRTEFEECLKRRLKHEKMIFAELKKAKMPKEISALPHVESSYQVDAISKVGAIGLWQVMPNSAKLYGFKHKNLKDPKVNTKAGLSILAENYRQLESWPLAITAYNHGLAGVKRAVKQTGTENICTIIDQYDGPKFGVASRNFFASFLAVVRILKERGILEDEEN